MVVRVSSWTNINLALFGKKKSGGNGETDESTSGAFNRDDRKASEWFKHARVAADGYNYDYAIECFINGLRFDVDNMNVHEELWEIARRRKVNGGKPAGMKDKMKSLGKDPVSKMLDAEKVMAMDPLNVQQVLVVLDRIADVIEVEDEVALGDLVLWLGGEFLDQARSATKPRRDTFIKAKDIFRRAGVHKRAVEACRLALSLSPQDAKLHRDLKEHLTEQAITEGNYDTGGEEGGFKQSVRNMGEQRALEQEEGIAATSDVLDEVIARCREQYKANSDDLALLSKLVDALRKREIDETENEAVTLLVGAHEQTGQYQFKVSSGDIQMKQLTRHLRELKKAHEKAPTDLQVRKAYSEAARHKLIFELEEFADRVRNYPTHLGLRYQYGVRLFQAQRYEDAISAFQQSKGDPKVRAASHCYLGQAYVKQDWLDEAIETLNDGIKAHALTDDRMGMELRYYLMDAMERKARADSSIDLAGEARKIASQLLQTDITYRDIRKRMNAIRALEDELKKKPAGKE